MLGNYQVATQLVASRVVLSSIELVSYVKWGHYIGYSTSRTVSVYQTIRRNISEGVTIVFNAYRPKIMHVKTYCGEVRRNFTFKIRRPSGPFASSCEYIGGGGGVKIGWDISRNHKTSNICDQQRR
jgi:hypothetical protein